MLNRYVQGDYNQNTFFGDFVEDDTPRIGELVYFWVSGSSVVNRVLDVMRVRIPDPTPGGGLTNVDAVIYMK